MDSMVCPGCNLRIEPIKIFDRSKKTRKPYLLTRCPRERCGFYIDIEDYNPKLTPPGKEKPKNDDDRRNLWGFNI